MNVAIAIIGLVAAIGAAVAAFGSWRAATKANESTAALTAIEQDRRHEEVTPEFEITCTKRANTPDSADLYVALKRAGLEHIDGVTLTILDEKGKDHWRRGLPDGVTQNEAETFVWGGWEFNPGASEQSLIIGLPSLVLTPS